MKILVCGGRNFDDRALMGEALVRVALEIDSEPVIVHGGATGADSHAGLEATRCGWWAWRCPADWRKHGKAAGPIRNQQMLDEAKPDWVLAFPTEKSKGTWDMVSRAEKAGVPVWVARRGEKGMEIEERGCDAAGEVGR